MIPARLTLLLLTLCACGTSTTTTTNPDTLRISDPVQRLLSELDRDGSGSLGQDELQAHDPAALLPMLDSDGDGQVSLEELRTDLNTWPEPRSATPDPGRSPPPGDLPPPVLRPGEQERPEDAKDGPPTPGRRP